MALENVEQTSRLLQESTAPLDPANIDAEVDPDLARLALEWFGALARGDLEWVFAHTEPDIEIAQPPALPDARSYRGHQGLVDAFGDWFGSWDELHTEIVSVSQPAPDRLLLTSAMRGRGEGSGIEVEAEIVFAAAVRDLRLTRWEMFMSRDEALEAMRAWD